jgi:general secretion pathway protein H
MAMGYRSRQHGFTLLEIMVVVAIIGIVLSVAVLSLNTVGNDEQIDTEVLRFESLVETARDEALLQGREYGIEFLQQGYRFLELDPVTRQWGEIFGDDILRHRDLPPFLEFELYLEGQQIELNYEAVALDAENDETLKQFQPHVFLFSSGDMTPFELYVRHLDREAAIGLEGDLLGGIARIEDEFE